MNKDALKIEVVKSNLELIHADLIVIFTSRKSDSKQDKSKAAKKKNRSGGLGAEEKGSSKVVIEGVSKALLAKLSSAADDREVPTTAP